MIRQIEDGSCSIAPAVSGLIKRVQQLEGICQYQLNKLNHQEVVLECAIQLLGKKGGATREDRKTLLDQLRKGP